jgi:pyochelin biosynthesis protein PchC
MTLLADDASRWLRRYHPAAESRIRLLYFPHAGGSASFCFPLSRVLSPSIEVLAVQYPGRQDRRSEPCIEDISRLADALADALDGVGDRPTAFFGHSMGAILAFEVAERFQAGGRPMPVRLIASARRAPSTVRHERVHLAGDDGIIADMRTLSGTDEHLLDDDDLLRMVLPTIRADYRAIETYEWTPGPPLECPITVLVGDSDPKVTVDEARLWEKHTVADFEMHVYPGGHFYLGGDGLGVADVIRRQLAAYL